MVSYPPMKRRLAQPPQTKTRSIIVACIAAGVAAFFIVSIVSLRGKHSFVKNERDMLQTEINETRDAVERMDRSLQAIESPDAHERLLREQFRVVGEGEELIVIVPEE